MAPVHPKVRAGLAAAAAAAAVLIMAPAAQATITPAPFTDFGITWCTSYHDYMGGCTAIDNPTSPHFDVPFDPAQDTRSGNVIKLGYNGSAAGAVNTYNETNFAPPFTMFETLSLPCDASGNLLAWPAAWTVSKTAPAGTDEYDFLEVLKVSGVNQATATIHFKNAAGQPDSRSVAPPKSLSPSGSWCGEHKFQVHVTPSEVTVTWATHVVADWTAASLGIPSFDSSVQYLIDDYGQSTTIGGASVPGTFFNVTSALLTNS